VQVVRLLDSEFDTLITVLRPTPQLQLIEALDKRTVIHCLTSDEGKYTRTISDILNESISC